MNKLGLAALLVAAVYFGAGKSGVLEPFSRGSVAQVQVPAGQDDALARAFAAHQSGVEAVGDGVVSKLLADDTQGSRHQRFLLTLATGQTLLVAHNIDLAPRLDALQPGDSVAFKGVYEWNAKGGVVHWTHRDPSGRHEAGWLRHAGRTYQ